MKTNRIYAVAVLAMTALATFLFPEMAAAATLFGDHVQHAPHAAAALKMATLAAGGAAAGNVDMQAVLAEFQAATNEVKNLAEDLNRKYAAGQTVTQEAKDRADQALTRMNELGAQVGEIEQKLARRGGGAETAVARTMGQIVAESEHLAEYASRRGKAGKLTIDIGAIGADISTTSAGALVAEQRVPGILGIPQRRMTVRALLAPGRTASNSILYVQETGFTNNAEVVTEGTLKPQSELTFDDVNQAVVTIAHWVKANKQILADAPQLSSFIDGRLRYGLAYKEEQQLLHGTGSNGEISGLVTEATAYSAPFSLSGATMIDKIRLGLLQAALAEFPSDGVVVNPIDWARIELTKDSEGRYIIGNPQGTAQPTLWSVPVVATQAMTVDKFLAGAFGMGAQIFDREDASVQLSDEDGDNFVKNKVTILAEARLAMAVYRPEAFIYGDFGNVA